MPCSRSSIERRPQTPHDELAVTRRRPAITCAARVAASPVEPDVEHVADLAAVVVGAVADRSHLVGRGHDLLRQQEAGGQLFVRAGRAHDGDERRRAEPDFERLFGGGDVAPGHLSGSADAHDVHRIHGWIHGAIVLTGGQFPCQAGLRPASTSASLRLQGPSGYDARRAPPAVRAARGQRPRRNRAAAGAAAGAAGAVAAHVVRPRRQDARPPRAACRSRQPRTLARRIARGRGRGAIGRARPATSGCIRRPAESVSSSRATPPTRTG